MLYIPRPTLASNLRFFWKVLKGQQNFLEEDGMSRGEFLAWMRTFKQCADFMDVLTDREYKSIIQRIQNHHSPTLKMKLGAMASILVFCSLCAFSQPRFSNLTSLDFVPTAVSLDTAMTAETGKLTRFYQVKNLGLGEWSKFQIYYQPRDCGQLEIQGKGICRNKYGFSIPIKEPGTYFVRFFGQTGHEARACIEVPTSKSLTAKFWKP